MIGFVVLCALLAAPLGSPGQPPGKHAEERKALERALLSVIERSPLKNARITVQIRSLDDGSVIFSQHQDELLNPASNVKLFTAAAALARLGPDYRFDTEFLTDNESRESILKDGKVKTLFVRGKGDPSLTTERLYAAVSDLLHFGLKEVTGDIVLDESYFDGEREPPGYDQERGDRAYLAPTGALSLNWNSVGVFLRPGPNIGAAAVAEMEPASDYFVVENDVLTGNKTQRRFNVTSSIDKDRAHQKIEIDGYVPFEKGSWSVNKRIELPPLYLGHTLKQLLAQRGVKVKGRIRVGQAPFNAKILTVHQSETLDIVLKKLQKFSSNFVAEQLIKVLGAEGRGVPGTHANGIAVVEEFLDREVGIKKGTYVMRNGSGLNDTNRFSAAQVNVMLKYMWDRFPLAPEYLSALGIAGKDGTLKYRFEGTDAVWRLRAKTGTLENVSALAGYVQSVGGEKFVFSVMANDFPGRASTVVAHIDAVGAAVAAIGATGGPSAVIAAMTPASVVGTEEELLTRLKTYAEMGAKAEKRNAPFLRTAWRAEKDPAVRAAIADALYQSDPREWANARILLDTVAPGEDVFGRLRRAARKLNLEVPTVAPVIELAASGNAEALQRLFELVRVAEATDDQKLKDDLADALAAIGNEATNEMLYAFRVAPQRESEAALDAMAHGLVRAAQPDAPWWAGLKAAQGSLDPRAVEVARTVETVLSLKIAEAKAVTPVDVASPPPAAPAKPASSAAPSPGG
ncbi:MAG: D-alanyl-D-alanine carboxypeptidase/D-alanyl-D-alanine-endopeptidase [Myxococcaceae bacterium]|nr:D-alanyl-D-alanine carboxypeptidase/D-alanyl-D-alanine-endopeptidase [Myxococcaceae bacterium]